MIYQASSMSTLNEELKIPEKYLKWTEDKILAIVHKKWIAGFLNFNPVDFITHNQLDSDEIAAQPSLDELGPDWSRVYIKIYKKKFLNARTLAKERCNITTSKKGLELTFAQVLHYVATTNYQHLWKDYYKKYYAPWTILDQREQSNTMGYSISDVELMKEIINRMYGCLIVKYEDNQLTLVKQADSSKIHCNMLPAIFVVETKTSFVIFYEQAAKYSIRECLTYSPAAITTSYAKPLFLTYQLLKLSRDLRDCGLFLGEITLSDILLMDNFNIQVLPNLEDNIHILPETTNKENTKSSDIDCTKNYRNLNISELCEMWVHGQLNNFDYLSALNDLAGRRYGDPSCHHVMPWVTDFSTRGGSNWRDFTKSKFRLNKGDRQLDLTFDTESEEIGYHVSDVLSEITYYVYLSRRYSRSILCKNVRPLWVPGEYPASISRLHEWTPDECIPQFFTDPSVFKSIHEDLPDLEIPSWATSPEDFIEKHRECLESSYVSERLHHWIDLTFGYKLSGQAAIKSKNVCLHLVDNHTNLSNFGVVQLFTNPHPQKIVPSPFWSKMPPRLRNFSLDEKLITSLDESAKGTNDEHRSSGDEEEAAASTNATRASPLAFTRFLSRSRSSLPLIDDSGSKSEKPNEQPIVLPKEYNPVSALIQVETSHAFFNRVNHGAYKPKISSNKTKSNVKQAVLTARLRESQILGCLIIEIFLAEKFRATWKVEKISFEDRLNNSLNLIKTSPISLPKCVKNAVMLLLRVDIFSQNYNSDIYETHHCSRPTSLEQFGMSIEREPKVTFMGLPPPSAHQLLEPVLSGLLFPSTKSLQYLYNVVEMIQNYNNLNSELDRATQNIHDENCQEYTRIVFLSKINECKVKAIANELEKLLPNANIATEMSVQLIVPHIRQIFEQPLSVVLAAWHLFDPIARAIGPRETAKVFLKPLMNLYDRGSLMDRSELSNNLPANLVTKFKTIRLYHRSFLLKLIVRLGLKCFLENFITPLVEAVGGYRNHFSGSLNSNFEKAGILKNCPLTIESCNTDNVLSPLDEDSSVESEFILSGRNASTSNDSKCNANCSKNSEISENNEEMFMMETEDKLYTQAVTAQTPHSLDLNLDFNVEIEDFGKEVKTSVVSTARSPEIPIPPKAFDGTSNKLVPELNSICCKVGSTSTSEDIPYSTIYETPTNDSKSDGSFGNTRDDSVASSSVDPETSFVYVRKEDLLSKRDLSGAREERQRRFNSIECSASEMSAESVIWLSHRLGPVLTARYLSRNLLRMLTLCYFSRENLTPLPFDSDQDEDKEPTIGLRLSGDANASKVLECLTSIVGLYGEHTIVLQYFSHITELVAQCKRKLTPSLEGGLISCIVLLIHLIPYLNDSSLMDVIHEVIVKSILLPTVRILSTSRFSFPNGSMARFVLANKYLEILLILIIRLGNVMSKNHLTVPIQRFFMTFEKVYNFTTGEKHYDVEVRTLRDTCENQKKNETDDSISPFSNEELNDLDSKKLKALKEVKEVFSASLAHKAYVAFYRLLKDEIMDELVKNHQMVRDLFHEFEQELLFPSSSNIAKESKQFLEYNVKGFGRAGSLGIKVKVQDFMTTRCPSVDDSIVREPSPFLATGRQLRGNWLAYWEHEIGRSDKDTNFNIKQIKLQTFIGHTNSVRCLYVLDNENSFMSGARDRTIKLWSLRSQGDGSISSSCQYTYNGHKKSILSLTFLESLRYAVTCDSTIHCWDPFMGAFLGCPESPRAVPVNVLAASPAPSTTILVATTDITLRVIDCRTFQYVNDMKVSMSPTGLIRCIAVAPSGHWVALGQASGFLTILDIRTGLIIASWKGHECEILQLETVNETTIISSSLDQTIAVWSAIDGKLKFYLKGVTEPIHCMSVYNQQLISGTTANRIGVHSALEVSSPFSFSKLRYDAFKGVLTSMALLPLNRLLLLGADNGNINLIC